MVNVRKAPSKAKSTNKKVSFGVTITPLAKDWDLITCDHPEFEFDTFVVHKGKLVCDIIDKKFYIPYLKALDEDIPKNGKVNIKSFMSYYLYTSEYRHKYVESPPVPFYDLVPIKYYTAARIIPQSVWAALQNKKLIQYI